MYVRNNERKILGTVEKKFKSDLRGEQRFEVIVLVVSNVNQRLRNSRPRDLQGLLSHLSDSNNLHLRPHILSVSLYKQSLLRYKVSQKLETSAMHQMTQLRLNWSKVSCVRSIPHPRGKILVHFAARPAVPFSILAHGC